MRKFNLKLFFSRLSICVCMLGPVVENDTQVGKILITYLNSF